MPTTNPATTTATYHYTTAAQDAAVIRAELKRRGLTSRQVSVRSESYSMGSSIHVTIKVPGISKSMVEKIANRAERIDRDQFGGILSGGNRFVFVDFDSDAHAAKAAAIEKLLPTEPTGDDRWVRLDVTDWWVKRDRRGMMEAFLSGDQGRPLCSGCPEGLARMIAQAVDA